jgi:5-bromo-4-chloroindolyl phosphate hydrolysis protein
MYSLVFQNHELHFNFQNEINQETFSKSVYALLEINNLTISKDIHIYIQKRPKNMNQAEFYSSNIFG